MSISILLAMRDHTQPRQSQNNRKGRSACMAVEQGSSTNAAMMRVRMK